MRARGYNAALPSVLKEKTEEKLYRLYMTDALKAAYHLNSRFADLLPELAEKKETATSEDGRARIKNKLKGGE